MLEEARVPADESGLPVKYIEVELQETVSTTYRIDPQVAGAAGLPSTVEEFYGMDADDVRDALEAHGVPVEDGVVTDLDVSASDRASQRGERTHPESVRISVSRTTTEELVLAREDLARLGLPEGVLELRTIGAEALFAALPSQGSPEAARWTRRMSAGPAEIVRIDPHQD